MQSCKTIWVGSRFVTLENRDYEQRIKYQIERNSFKQLPQDPHKQFEMKVNNWIEKWHSKNILDSKWKSFIIPLAPLLERCMVTLMHIKKITLSEL